MQDEHLIRQMTAIQNPLYAFILTLLPRRQEAEEVLQNTQVEIWQKKESFTPGTNFLAWACRIAHFKVLEYRRATARERLIFDEGLINMLAVESEPFYERRAERIRALDDCLGDLPSRHRDLIRQRYEAGTTVKQMAEYHGRSAGSLAVTLFRLRRLLLDCVERKMEEEVQG